jgi:hypothetical protein
MNDRAHKKELVQAAASAVQANCAGPILGQMRDLRMYTVPRLHEIELGLDLIKPPDAFDQIDAARSGTEGGWGPTYTTASEPKSWGVVILSSEYRKLSQQDRESARQQYFREVVAPRLRDPALVADGQKYFNSVYGPQVANEVSEEPKTDPLDAMLAARASGKEVDETITIADRTIDNCLGGKRDASIAETPSKYPIPILTAIFVGVVPSMLLLTIGLMVSWVAAGFRRRGSD